MTENARCVLFCIVDGEDVVFEVKVPISDDIADLKDHILRRGIDKKYQVRSKRLTLWKLHEPLLIAPVNDLVDRLWKRGTALPQFAEELHEPTFKVSHWFPEVTLDDYLYIVVKLPSPGITPSLSNESKLSRPSTSVTTPSSNLCQRKVPVPNWLAEIHQKLWGRRDLVGQIFRKVNLTKTDFGELQDRLHNLDPSRSSESYIPTDVFAAKSEFLRSKSFVDEDTAVYFATCDAASDGNLVPQPVIDTSKDVTPPNSATADIEAFDVGANVMDDAMNVDAGYDSGDLSSIDVDTGYLSEGPTAVFPCTIRYIDLTPLNLKHLVLVPHVMVIRDEWRTMVDIFNRRKKGIRGGAAFTGQPGIGKTCMLYYIFILCILRAQSMVFQDMHGRIFLINDEVHNDITRVEVPGKDVLALVDADGEVCVPHPYLFETNLRVLLISPPKTRQDRKWLTQSVQAGDAVFLVKPWSREDFLVAMLFMSPIDVTLKRLQDVICICGYNPRECGAAAESPHALEIATQKVRNAIRESRDLAGAVRNVVTGQPIHRAFELWPSPDNRSWECCVTRPVSDWVFSQVIAELDRRDADAAYNFYRNMQATRDSASLGGKMFENKVHKFFQSITTPRKFIIRSIDDPSTTFDIDFSSAIGHHVFGAEQVFAGHLTSSVRDKVSCYLRPLSPVFPTFDSFLYQHGRSQSGCQPLIAIQVTTAAAHPISVRGLARIQACLEMNVPELKNLRPTAATKLIILFVVPDPMAASFVKQIINDAEKDAHWDTRTTQYVLGLPVREVMRS